MQPFFGVNVDLEKPWLILGKGPSFEKIYELNLENYNLFGLNHVSTLIPVDIAHFIDADVISTRLIENAKIVVCPYRLHVLNRCKEKKAYDYFEVYNDYFEIVKKIYCYNCSTYKGKAIELLGPTVKVRYFSGEAAFRLLALKKVKNIFSLGIDGGIEYASQFNHLKALTNNRLSFDAQFIEINSIVEKWQLNWVRL